MKGAKQIKKFIVYLSTGEGVYVEADDYQFDTDSEANNVWFYVKDGIYTKYVAAVFNFANIQGFCRLYTNEEKEQK